MPKNDQTKNKTYKLRYFNFDPSFKPVQTLLWSLEFVIQISLEHDTIAIIINVLNAVILGNTLASAEPKDVSGLPVKLHLAWLTKVTFYID